MCVCVFMCVCVYICAINYLNYIFKKSIIILIFSNKLTIKMMNYK